MKKEITKHLQVAQEARNLILGANVKNWSDFMSEKNRNFCLERQDFFNRGFNESMEAAFTMACSSDEYYAHFKKEVARLQLEKDIQKIANYIVEATNKAKRENRKEAKDD